MAYLIIYILIVFLAWFLSARSESKNFKENSNIFLGAIIFVLIVAGIISLVFS